MHETGDKKLDNHDVPKLDPNTILPWVITSAIFSILGILYAFWWVIIDPVDDLEHMSGRARAVTPFLAAGAAIVTYLTVLWRGAIARIQADEQKRQNDSSEKAELVDMLERANQHLCKDTAADKLLGLTLLEVVATGTNERYALIALRMAAREIVWIHRAGPIDFLALNAQLKRVFYRAAEENNRILTERLFLEFAAEEQSGESKKQTYPFSPFLYLPLSTIYSADILLNSDIVQRLNGGEKWLFRRCRIYPNRVEDKETELHLVDERFLDCSFEGTTIKAVSVPFILDASRGNIFNRCRFPRTVFLSSSALTGQGFSGCSYPENAPPQFKDENPERLLNMLKENAIDIQKS